MMTLSDLLILNVLTVLAFMGSEWFFSPKHERGLNVYVMTVTCILVSVWVWAFIGLVNTIFN